MHAYMCRWASYAYMFLTSTSRLLVTAPLHVTLITG